ncbi:MAG: enolase C-terminal domain-like protein [Anaerolineae bacterium]|nr:enolase C-terminal domain-like protein [Anaerolineae bacterium]
MSAKIQNIDAREMMASRGTLGLEVIVTTDTGAVGRATPSSGVSTGKYEARFVLDGGRRFGGKGLRQAVANIEKVTPQLLGMEVSKQREIDTLLTTLDGTVDKSRLGANAIVGISLAVCKAGANAASIPLYQYIGGVNANTMPMPIFGICLCGRYRDPGKTRWLKPSYEIIPYGATGFESAVEMAYEMQQAFSHIIIEKYGINTYRQQSLVNSYSAFWMPGVIRDDREILDAMTEAIINSGNEHAIGIYYDAAAGCYYEENIDRYVGIYSAGEKTREQMVHLYKEFVANYPVISLEDPLHEEDMEGHARLTQELGIEIVGDDLFTTNIDRVKMGIEMGAANSMVLKITQVGTVSEALDAANTCLQHGYNVHPCGSRGDRDSIADFALGLGAGQVRAFDWHRMRELEATLGPAARWPGKALFKGQSQG